MSRPVLAAIAVLLLAAACRIHVTIWLLGHPVARPPIAGLVLAVLIAAVLFVAFMIARTLLRDGRSSPYPRIRFAV